MAISRVLLCLSFLFAIPTLAAPTDGNACTNLKIRKEWRNLNVDEKNAYIGAVKCLMSKPPQTKDTFPIIKSRYEDFVAMHLNITMGPGMDVKKFNGIDSLMQDPWTAAASVMNGVHGNGKFLPWHRYAIQVYEDTLSNECGYQGAQPYWDYHLDNTEAGGDFLKSPIFDAATGFGGNGAKLANPQANPALSSLVGIIPGLDRPLPGGSGGGCLLDGPFKDDALHIGPMGLLRGNTTRCLARNFNAMPINVGATKKNYARVLAAPTFNALTDAMEQPVMKFSFDANGIAVSQSMDFHSVGHSGVGGEMGDPFNSPNDPLFWMHHTGMDRIWALWQEQDLSKRLADIKSPMSMADATPLTLNGTVEVGVLGPAASLGSVMDTQNRDGKGILCYKYEGLDMKYYNS